jgi:hypothetical protein
MLQIVHLFDKLIHVLVLKQEQKDVVVLLIMLEVLVMQMHQFFLNQFQLNQ